MNAGPKKKEREKLRRGIYVLPNLFTTLNLFCGFYSVIAAIEGHFLAAAVAVIVAGVFDHLDGKIARATHTTSRFGVEYDSLADLVSFGLAPGLMMYLWVLHPAGKLGWLAAFLFLACGALRLARFNTQVSGGGEYFTGLPIPAAAGMCAVVVLMCHRFNPPLQPHPLLILVLVYLLSLLMVSTVRYNSFKKVELLARMNFNMLVRIVLVLIFIAAEPHAALFLLGVAYVASGPFTSIRKASRRRQKTAAAETGEKPVRPTPVQAPEGTTGRP